MTVHVHCTCFLSFRVKALLHTIRADSGVLTNMFRFEKLWFSRSAGDSCFVELSI